MARRKNRPLANGRNPTSRFVRLDHRILKSAAYRSLGLAARALLVELAMMENGQNNGSLYLSVTDATDRLGLSERRVAMAAFDELEARGFIAMTKNSSFHVKAAASSRARCWRLTWQRYDEKGPTNDWERAEPEAGSRDRKRMERGLRALKSYRRALSENRMPGVDFTPLNPISVEAGGVPGVNSTPAATENRQIAATPIGMKSTPHTAVTMGYGAGAAEPMAAGIQNSTAAIGGAHNHAGVVRTCENCSAAFTLDRSDRAAARRFCSEPCRKRAERRRARQREKPIINSPSAPPPIDDHDSVFKERLGQFWEVAYYSARIGLAAHVGLTPVELSAGVRDVSMIPIFKRAAILSELRSMAA
jgi:hypothetical protein